MEAGLRLRFAQDRTGFLWSLFLIFVATRASRNPDEISDVIQGCEVALDRFLDTMGGVCLVLVEFE